MDATALFAASGLALYAGHHVGDYWIQTDHQARHKGDAGAVGRAACTAHVLTYLTTQIACLLLLELATGVDMDGRPTALALLISGATHYAADRREYGLMFQLARLLPGKVNFLTLGAPRSPRTLLEACGACGGDGHAGGQPCSDCLGRGYLPERVSDNPTLGTGAWALDQSWHLAFGVFVPALIIAAWG